MLLSSSSSPLSHKDNQSSRRFIGHRREIADTVFILAEKKVRGRKSIFGLTSLRIPTNIEQKKSNPGVNYLLAIYVPDIELDFLTPLMHIVLPWNSYYTL